MRTGKRTAKVANSTVEVRFPDFVDVDRIGLAEDIQFLLRDTARQTDRQARARERMPPDDIFRNAELTPEVADLVLEEFADAQPSSYSYVPAIRRRCDAI